MDPMVPGTRIGVLIADDHEVVADGLAHLLGAHDDIEVVGIARSGREAVRQAIALEPDVILMDTEMRDLNGIEATRELRSRSHPARVIVLSVQSEIVHVVRAMRAGAMGYVPKRSAGRDVVDAIRVVHAGRRYLHPAIAQEVVERLAEVEEHDEDPLVRLSPRERQALQLIAEGRTVTEIAAALSLSTRTVETYRARLMEKLGIRDVPNLVKFAIRHGLTSLE
jgi:DNA-binding NarL/FixJ family response regulator